MLVLCLLCMCLCFLITHHPWTSQYYCGLLSTNGCWQVQGGNASISQAEDKAHSASVAVTQQSGPKQAGAMQSSDQQNARGQEVQGPEYLNAVSADAHQEGTSPAGVDSMTHADDSDADRVMLGLDDEMEGLISSAADPDDRVMLDLDDEMEGLISSAAAPDDRVMLDLDDEMEGLISSAAAETDGSVVAVLAKLSEPKVEAAPGWTHADVLKAEQAVGAAQLAEGKDFSALNQPEGIVIQLEQHEPTAEEDASQHLQLKHIQDVNAAAALNAEAVQDLDAVSAVAQPVQPGNGAE